MVRLPLKNVSLGGALIHSHVPLPLESVHRVAFDSGGRSLSVQVRVARVADELSADGERAHLIAVEFLSVQPALLQLIERWLSEGQGEAAGSVSA
ncbi:MAG: PilZ domain-containing protein [Acidobacteriota bacterium]